MPSSSSNTLGVLPTLNRHGRRSGPAKPSDWSSSYQQGSYTQISADPPAITKSTTVAYGPSPVHRCPTRIQFSVALDLPRQRRSHQRPAWLNSHYKAGCHCHWATKHTEGRLEGLVCDAGPHYYHRSKNGTLVRGPLKPLAHRPAPPLHDRIPASAKPVTWPDHDPKAVPHHPTAPAPHPIPARHPDKAPSNPPKPVEKPANNAPKKPVEKQANNAPKKPVEKQANNAPTKPVEKQVNNAPKKPVAGQTKPKPPPPVLARPAASKSANSSSSQAPTNRQIINIPITQSPPNTPPSPQDGARADTTPPVARTGTATSRIEVPDKTTIVGTSTQAPDSSVTPAPAAPAAEDAPGNSRQVVYTSTSSAMNANYTAPSTSPTINNSNTLSSNHDDNLPIPPAAPANDSLAKALGGTFAGIIGLSLLLIAGVLLGRRRSAAARPRESFAGLRRSRQSSIIAPAPVPPPQMIQIPAPIGASPHQAANRSALMSPADPETRYSSNGTGLLTKLQGTTASLQRAGLITPSGSHEHEDVRTESNAAETIVGPVPGPMGSRSSPNPFTELRNPDNRESVGTQAESIYNPFANEQSISSDHHFSGSQRQSLATDLSYPNGSSGGGGNLSSSGEIEAVRFGSSPNSDTAHVSSNHDGTGRGSGDVEPAWWGGA